METILENEVLQTGAAITSLTDKERRSRQRGAVPRGPHAMISKQGTGPFFFTAPPILKQPHPVMQCFNYSSRHSLSTEQIPIFILISKYEYFTEKFTLDT